MLNSLGAFRRVIFSLTRRKAVGWHKVFGAEEFYRQEGLAHSFSIFGLCGRFEGMVNGCGSNEHSFGFSRVERRGEEKGECVRIQQS